MLLDQKNLPELKNKLLVEKRRLEEELGRIGKRTNIPGDYSTTYEDIGTDVDENASEVEQYSDNLALGDTLEKELGKVNIALKKMENGNYGICENCGEKIDIERLKAYPAAQNCITCKTKILAGK